MFEIYVIPAGEDQVAFEEGKKPAIVFKHEFATEIEREEYINGLEAVYDLAEYSIEDETPTTLTVIFDDADTEEFEFEAEAEKEAFKLGMDDGEGFREPLVISPDEDREDFSRLSELLKE